MGSTLLCQDGSDRADRAVRDNAALSKLEAEIFRVRRAPFDLGSPILDEARRRGASLIVVGRAAGALLARADRPLLAVPEGAGPPAAGAPILFCFDGSPEARQAIGTAAALLAGRRAIVAGVVPAVDDVAVLRTGLPWPPAGDLRDRVARIDRREADAPAALAAEGAALAEAAGFVASPLGLGGAGVRPDEEREPFRLLLRAAAKLHASCIVTGHRRDAPPFGSTARGLVEHADRPVLVVPGPR